MKIRNFTPHPINILDADNKEITTIAPDQVKRKRGRPKIKAPKKQFATRLNQASMTWLDERKRAGFKKATTVEAALAHYRKYILEWRV